MINKQKRIALLIDCENTSHKSIHGVISRLSNHGRVCTRHAHGDWNKPSLNGWRKALQVHALRPISHVSSVAGKNSTDVALIINAMDLLYSNQFDAFALMTSDNDFANLALRIRESGLPVYGFGKRNTAQSLTKSCTAFYSIDDNLNTGSKRNLKDKPSTSPKKKKKGRKLPAGLIRFLEKQMAHVADKGGMVKLIDLEDRIIKQTKFSSVQHGYPQLRDLIENCGIFSIQSKKGSGKYCQLKKRLVNNQRS